MSFTYNEKCTRCGRSETFALEDTSQMSAVSTHIDERAKIHQQIEEFFASLPVEHLPDLITAEGGRLVIHDYLCKGNGAKRSCTKSVAALVDSTGKLPERAPTTRKKKSVESVELEASFDASGLVADVTN